MRRTIGRIVHAALSVSIFHKVLGINVLVSAIFGAISAYQLNRTVAAQQYDNLFDQARVTSGLLAAGVAPSLMTNDLVTVRKQMDLARTHLPEIAFIEITDPQGTPIVSTRGVGDPVRDAIPQVTAPILDGALGTVRVGLSDTSVHTYVQRSNRIFLITVGFCALVALAAAFALTFLLSRPVLHLADCAHAIRAGDLGAQARVYFDDEIGTLATAFNDMTRHLRHKEMLIEEKNAQRDALMRKIVERGEEERHRIARDLHDGLGQSLSTLLLQLRGTRCATTHAPCPISEELAQKIQALVDEVRQMAFVLRPSILDDFGIAPALAKFAATVNAHAPCAVDFQYIRRADETPIPREIETHLYRIAQEATTNAMRHAAPSSVSIVLIRDACAVSLIIEDDGRGFDPTTATGGVGLAGMRERARHIGGSLIVDSSVGRGTTIKVTVAWKG